jgi:N-methylhydantoinase B/oxoprolinase/acetone carboxylase alpha subunit
MARSTITRRDGTEEVIPSKVVTWLAPGDRVVVSTAGGGGFGLPAAREPDAVARDVADGKVGVAAAGSAYRSGSEDKQVRSAPGRGRVAPVVRLPYSGRD